MIIADTDVLIDALRGREPSRSRVAREMSAGLLATTAMNAFELLSGARTPNEAAKVQTLLGALSILPVDIQASVQAAEVRRHLEAQGQTIGMADYLIAGVCLARGASLLTRNRHHFERVPGLLLGSLAPEST